MPLFSLWHLNWVFLWLCLNVFHVLGSRETFSLGLERERELSVRYVSS